MEGEDGKLVEAASCGGEWHAEAIAAALRARGIAAQAVGGTLTGFRAEAPVRAKVLVRRADLLRAKAEIDAMREENSKIDWERVDVGRPSVDVDGPDLQLTHEADAARVRRARWTGLIGAGLIVVALVTLAFRGRVW